MKLFISWSGERSRLLAESLRKWLPAVINAVQPWLSSNDIDPGTRWGTKLAGELEKTRYGVLCMTSENLDAPWLLFEAGAISKYVDGAHVVPLLLDITPVDIKAPIAQFQALQAEKDDIKKLLVSINETATGGGERGLDPSIIDEAFELWWPRLKSSIDAILEKSPTEVRNTRPERELIEEILILVRKLSQSATAHNGQRRASPLDNWDLEGMPPPPDHFPTGWDTEWQPSFENSDLVSRQEAKTESKSKPKR